MKYRRILIATNQLVRAEIRLPVEQSEKVFQSFLRESAVPLLEHAVRAAATNGTGCMQIDVRVSDFEDEPMNAAPNRGSDA